MSVKEIDTLVGNVFQVFAVEHWARFYYAVEKDGGIFVEIPEEVVAVTETHSPTLASFLREINGQKTDFEISQKQVGEFVFKTFEVSDTAQGRLTKVFESPEFRIESRLFSLWLAGHEGLLDQRHYAFSDWAELFGEWKKDEKVQKYAASLGKTDSIDEPENKNVH
jgi:hypothetical protein